jgi:hypothetical protein
VVVVIFVVITSDLLLCRSNRIGLYVRVQQTAAPPHVLESEFRAVCNFCAKGGSEGVGVLGVIRYDVPRGFCEKSFPARLAWNSELICASPGPEWLRTIK